jgi:hypothetical protein
MTNTSNTALVTAAGAGSNGNALTTPNGKHKHNPTASAADPALACRFGNLPISVIVPPVQEIFRNLLREPVSMRDSVTGLGVGA